MSSPKRRSQPQIANLLQEWKADLGLLDWTIGVAFRSDAELSDGEGTSPLGDVTIVETRRQAFIRLLNPADAHPHSMEAYDIEVTLVHELLHCSLAAFTNERSGSHKDIQQEQAVHALSVSLVRMKRLSRSNHTARPPKAA